MPIQEEVRLRQVTHLLGCIAGKCGSRLEPTISASELKAVRALGSTSQDGRGYPAAARPLTCPYFQTFVCGGRDLNPLRVLPIGNTFLFPGK